MLKRLLIAGLLLAAGLSIAAVLTAASHTQNHPIGAQGIFMVDKLGAHLRFFDPTSYKEIANIEVPANPHDFVLAADHKTAWVPIYGDGVYGRNPHPGHEIEIVDLVAHKISATIDVAPWRAPHGIQIDRSGMLYVTCDLDRKVLVIDPSTRKIVDTIDTEGTGHWIAILPSGDKLYVASKDDRPFISVLDLKARKIAARIPAPKGVQGIAASPDGNTVVAMDFAEPLLIVIDPKSDKVIDRIPLKDQTKGAYKPYFSPDRGTVIAISENPAVADVFDAHHLRGPQTVISVGKDPMGVAFSADGRTALIANHGDGSVSIIDLKEPKLVRSFPAGAGIETLAWY